MSFASSLTSSWTSFNTLSPLTLPPLASNSAPPRSPTPQRKPSPSPSASNSSSTPRKAATKMRPLNNAAPRQLTSPSNSTFPASSANPSKADFFQMDGEPVALQAPLAPSGGLPNARLPASPSKKAEVPSNAGDGDDWNW